MKLSHIVLVSAVGVCPCGGAGATIGSIYSANGVTFEWWMERVTTDIYIRQRCHWERQGATSVDSR